MKPPKKELKALLNLAKECLEKPNSEVCQTYKDKILEACPSLKKDDAVFKAGDWAFVNQIGHREHGTLVLLRDSNLLYYPFRAIKLSGEEGDAFNSSLLIKADPKKVEELLIAEAKKRGFKKGAIVKELIGSNVGTLNSKNKKEAESDSLYLDVKGGLFCGNLCIFSNGKWVEFEETISLSEAERRLNLKIKID